MSDCCEDWCKTLDADCEQCDEYCYCDSVSGMKPCPATDYLKGHLGICCMDNDNVYGLPINKDCCEIFGEWHDTNDAATVAFCGDTSVDWGACCNSSGGCTTTIEDDCSVSSEWYDNGGCDGFTCPVNDVAACCIPRDTTGCDNCNNTCDTCQDLSNSECTALSGTHHAGEECGTTTNCDVSGCSECCYNDSPPPRSADIQYIQLPSGECVWMNCQDCPYPICPDDI
jgi:hypothetical protein